MYRLGPESGTLLVRTGRTGAAAKAGHDLVIRVETWEATLDVSDAPSRASAVLSVDATSLRVVDGTGGVQALDDDDRASIVQTIDDEILKRQEIGFRSTDVEVASDRSGLSVRGDLTLVGVAAPIAFELAVGDEGKLTGSAVLKQTDWGIKPYSALFGALKVADEVEVSLDASLVRVSDTAGV
jgi:polyisoprenoid-binding protein YceI